MQRALEREVVALKRRLSNQSPTVEELPAYLEEMFQIPVPDTIVTPGFDAPADHARTLWRGEQSVVTGAGRDSFKTLITSAVWFLLAKNGTPVIHFGAFDKQAKQTIEYLRIFGSLPWWQVHCRVGTTTAHFRSGGWIKCMPLTHANARSAHVPIVGFDEADECRPDVRKVAVNIASSRLGQRARTADLSTKNRPNGPMAKMIANAAKSGHRVHQWSYKEVTERCPDSRSGTKSISMWVNPKYLLASRMAPDKDTDLWREIEVFNGCESCALLPSCRGDLKRANGPLPIDDLIEKITDAHMTPQDWRSQKENIDPSLEGLVVPEWDEDRCVSENAVHDPTLPTACSQDFGLAHLAVTLIGQRIPVGHRPLLPNGERGEPNQARGRVHILDEYACHQPFEPEVVAYIGTNWFGGRYNWPSKFWIDPSGLPAVSRVRVRLPSGRWRTLVLRPANNKWDPGVRCLRGYCSPQPDGRAKLQVNPRCVQVIEEMSTVKHPQTPDGRYLAGKDKRTGGDDAHDALRYLLMGMQKGELPSAQEALDMVKALEQGGVV